MSAGLSRQQIVTWLGVLGIVPFLLALAWPDPDISFRAFSLYSLAIFCFLCGNWWSVSLLSSAITAPQRVLVLLLSNVLLLVALVLVFLEMPASLIGMAVLYAGLVAGESQLAVFARQPAYYCRMRRGVSAAVVLLHIAGWYLVT